MGVDDPIVQPHERSSSLWLKLEQCLTERIESYRRMNDGEMEPIKTAALRGRISELKKLRILLAMDIPSPAPTADSDAVRIP